MGETIKTYTEITVEEAGEMLHKGGWKPVDGLVFKHSAETAWKEGFSNLLSGIDLNPTDGEPFYTPGEAFTYCAKVTEIDPCKAPDGCPELEPWMAYVGNQPLDLKTAAYGGLYRAKRGGDWQNSSGPHAIWFRAIDVRTEWAQEHFPEHCRIRNYQEPDAFEAWLATRGIPAKGTSWPEILREAYELGQANAK